MDYNSRLKPIRFKGLCGDQEVVEEASKMKSKVAALAQIVKGSSRIVVFTGAGISTSCGIPDFRGPNGVWTKEQRGDGGETEIAEQHNSFDAAQPSFTHYALAALVHADILTHVVSQNVDGLHLKSGVPESKLSELHGNIFKERCETCGTEYLRDKDVGGMGLKYTGNHCSTGTCKGKLQDMAIDWDTPLPEHIFNKAHDEIDRADLLIVLGSSLRIRPAGNMPLRVLKPKVKRGGRIGQLCIVNLQKTHLDKKAAVHIRHYCDEVMRELCHQLGVVILYPPTERPTGVSYYLQPDCYLQQRGAHSLAGHPVSLAAHSNTSRVSASAKATKETKTRTQKQGEKRKRPQLQEDQEVSPEQDEYWLDHRLDGHETVSGTPKETKGKVGCSSELAKGSSNLYW